MFIMKVQFTFNGSLSVSVAMCPLQHEICIVKKFCLPCLKHRVNAYEINRVCLANELRVGFISLEVHGKT